MVEVSRRRNDAGDKNKRSYKVYVRAALLACFILALVVSFEAEQSTKYYSLQLEDLQLVFGGQSRNSKKEDSNLNNRFRSLPTDRSKKGWDSSKSAVLGLASGYGLGPYKQFVGSLRATGYPGHIILGIAADAPPDALHYLEEQNVTTKVVEKAERCTFDGKIAHGGKEVERMKGFCAKEYPQYKLTWGRFALYKDWLHDCQTCTDGIILTDVRDAFFQRDPFQTAVHTHAPLMVFEEIEKQTTTHWLTDFPIKTCKDGYVIGDKPMLCSGSTMGSREGILDYIDVMLEEFDVWNKKCLIDMEGDDQSIHNYLYYTNRLNATAIPHRTGPLHVVGWEAARIWERAQKESKEQGIEPAKLYVKDENKWQDWLPDDIDLLDRETGLIVNRDGSPSAQVHQVDRFGPLLHRWLDMMRKQGWPYNKE